MCFRPSVAEPIMNCPYCGKQIRSVLGTMPHECPWCEEDIAEAVIAFQAEQAAGAPDEDAPSAPAAPAAPSAPAAPKAPTAPGAPKAPAAPAAPKAPAPAARPNPGQ